MKHRFIMCRLNAPSTAPAAEPAGDARLSDAEAVVISRAYDQGARMLAAVGGTLPASLDRTCASGHLMRLCLAHRCLSRQPHSLASAPGTRKSEFIRLLGVTQKKGPLTPPCALLAINTALLELRCVPT